jgi:hypothetical protein
VVAGLGRRVVVVALTVAVVSGRVVVGGSVVVVLTGTREVTIEVTVTVRGSCSAPAPPAAAPTAKAMIPQMRPVLQARRHHGTWWLGEVVAGWWRPQPPGGPCGGWASHRSAGSVPSSVTHRALSMSSIAGGSTTPTSGVKGPISADALGTPAALVLR